MSLVAKIKQLADEKHTTFAEIERKINISNGQIRRWDTVSPKIENVQKVAKHLNVSVDYLLGNEELEIIDLSEDDAVFAFDGKPVSQEEREMLAAMIMAHRANKRNKR